MFLLAFPAIYLTLNGVYLILAVCVPFEFVVSFSRFGGVNVEPLTSTNRRSTLGAGIFSLVGGLIFSCLCFVAATHGGAPEQL